MTPRVLVVEDETALQQVLAYNLERAGFAVERVAELPAETTAIVAAR